MWLKATCLRMTLCPIFKTGVPLKTGLFYLGLAFMACTTAHPISANPSPFPAAGTSPAKRGEIESHPGTKQVKFRAVSLDGLTDTEKQIFEQIVDEEVCPCTCPSSWGACLQEGTKCQPAVLFAEYLIKQLAEGVSGEVMAEVMAQEISGYTSKPVNPATKGYHAKGSPKPVFDIVEYADFECMHCQLAAGVVDDLLEKSRDPVRVTFKHFPLSFHPMAETAAAAAEAAGNQGKFWEMHHAIFATQSMLDDDLLRGHARALGLDVKRWEKDWKSPAIIKKVKNSRAEGDRFKLESTPTFLINGRRFHLDRSVESFELRFALEKMRNTSSCQ